jgi:hypothetical protein
VLKILQPSVVLRVNAEKLGYRPFSFVPFSCQFENHTTRSLIYTNGFAYFDGGREAFHLPVDRRNIIKKSGNLVNRVNNYLIFIIIIIVDILHLQLSEMIVRNLYLIFFLFGEIRVYANNY